MSTTFEATDEATTVPPPATTVPGNRWDLLDVPAIGDWTPTRRVSVVLPYFNAPDALRLTLEALRHQTYPPELLEVVIADDGSDPPATVPDGLDDLDVVVARQEDLGFGLARVRNTGARAATGDIVLFVDCDMVPEPWHVEAHARWHHLVPDAVTIGFRRHVEFDGIGTEQIAVAASAGDHATDTGLGVLFDDGREVQVPTWIDGHMVRTEDLTSAHDDLFRIASGGNLGVRAETWWRVGGADESFTQWGAEDTETGWRLLNDGCLFVPDRDARCWHQGHGHEPEPHEVESLEQQRAKIAHLIAHRGFRSSTPGRVFEVPRVVVEVPAGGMTRADVARTVDAVLASGFSDLRVALDLGDDHPDAVWLTRQYGPDPRVVLAAAGEAFAGAGGAAVRIELPAGATVTPVTPDAVGAITARLESVDEPVGVLRATVPGLPASEARVVATTTRAWSRGLRAVEDPTDHDAVLDAAGAAFGSVWVAGGDVGVHAIGTEPEAPQPGGPGGGGAGALGSDAAMQRAYALFQRLEPSQRDAAINLGTKVFERTTPGQRARLIALVQRATEAGGQARRLTAARDPRSLARGLDGLLKVVLPARLYAALRRAVVPLARAVLGR